MMTDDISMDTTYWTLFAYILYKLVFYYWDTLLIVMLWLSAKDSNPASSILLRWWVRAYGSENEDMITVYKMKRRLNLI